MEEVELVAYAGIATSKGNILADYGRERDAYREAISSALPSLPQHVSQVSMGHGRLFVLFLVARDGIVFFCLGYDPLTKDQARGLLGRVRTAFLYAARKCDLHSGAPLPDATRDNIRKSFASTFRSHRGKIEEGAQPPLTIYHDAPFAYRTKSEDSFPAGESEDGEEGDEGEEVEEGGWDDDDVDDGDYSEGDSGGRGCGREIAELRGEEGADGTNNCDYRRSSANGGAGGGEGEAEGRPTAGTGTGPRSSRSNGQDSSLGSHLAIPAAQQKREQQLAAGGANAGGIHPANNGGGDGDDDEDAGWVDGAVLVTGQGLKDATWQRLPASDPGIGRGRGRRKGGGGGRSGVGGGNGGRGSASSRHSLTPRQRLLNEVGDVLAEVGAAGAAFPGGDVDPCFDLGQPVRPIDPCFDLGQPVRPVARNARSCKATAADCSSNASGSAEGTAGGAWPAAAEAAVAAGGADTPVTTVSEAQLQPSPAAPDRPFPGYPPRGCSTPQDYRSAAGTPPIAPSFASPSGFRGAGKRLSTSDRPPAGIAGGSGGGWNMSVTLPPQALAQLAAAMQEEEEEEGEGKRGGDGGEGGRGGAGVGFERRSVSSAVAAAQRGERAMVHSHSWNVQSSSCGEEGDGVGDEGVPGRRTISNQGRGNQGRGNQGRDSASPGMSRMSPLSSSRAFPDMAGMEGPYRQSPLSDMNAPSRQSPLAREIEELEKESGTVQHVPVISSSSPGRLAFPDIAPASARRSSLAQEIEELEGTGCGDSTSSSGRRLFNGGSGGDLFKGSSGGDLVKRTGGGLVKSSSSTHLPGCNPDWRTGPGSDGSSHTGGFGGYCVTGPFGMDGTIASGPSASPGSHTRSPVSAAAAPLRRTLTDSARLAAAGGSGGGLGGGMGGGSAGGIAVAAAAGAGSAAGADSTYLASPARSCASSIDARSEVMLRSPQSLRAAAAAGGVAAASATAAATVGRVDFASAAAFAPTPPTPDQATRPAFPDYSYSPSASPISTASPSRFQTPQPAPTYASSPSRSAAPPIPPSGSKTSRTSKVLSKAFGPKSPLSTMKSGSFWPVQSGWGGDASPASSTASGFSAAASTAASDAAAAAAGTSTPVAAGVASSISSSSNSGQKAGEGSIGKIWLKLFGKGWGKGGTEGGGSEGVDEGEEGVGRRGRRMSLQGSRSEAGEGEEGLGRRGRRMSLQGSRSEAGGAGEDEAAGQVRGRLRRNSLSSRLEKAGFRTSSAVGSNPWGVKGERGGEADGGDGREGGERGEGAAWQIGRGGGKDERKEKAGENGGGEEDDEGQGEWKGKFNLSGGAKSKGRASCSV